MTFLRPHRSILAAISLLPLLLSCSGGGGSSTPAAVAPIVTPPLPPILPGPVGIVSTASAFTTNCATAIANGTLYPNAEVEPHVAINPTNANNLIATWQQDRWSSGGAQGIGVGASFDGGNTWTAGTLPVSRCGGGNATNGGDFERASDPWVTFSPNGVAYQMSLGLTGNTLEAGSSSAMMVSRSTDSGRTWGSPISLVRDGGQFFNDKNTITADPTDARYVYAVWDRLTNDNRGPAVFARTTDGGLTWEATRSIYDPGVGNQTIGNIIAVLPDGTLVNYFTLLLTAANRTVGSFAVIRSTDKGLTWSQPITVASYQGIGTRDPETGNAIRDGGFLGQISVGAQGQLYVVWQDARFTNGLRDAIAFSRSTDGGLTWTAPTRVNADASVQGLIPTVNARADGIIGVSYFDMRSNTADPATLLTDYWLATSRDGVTWTDRRISAAFDLASAPVARGLFIGDYMGLVSNGSNFYPLYVRTNSNNTNNRNDVFMTPINVPIGTSEARASERASESVSRGMSDEYQQKVHENIVRKMEQRMPRWAARRGMVLPEQ